MDTEADSGGEEGDGDPEEWEIITGGIIPNIERFAPQEWHHLVMANIGDQIERYDVVVNTVPFFRLASWAETRLKQAADTKRQIARMKKE
jgi:hypothetical protein